MATVKSEDVDRLVDRIAGYGLAGTRQPLTTGDAIMVNSLDFNELYARVEHERVVGLLASAVADGAIVLERDAWNQLADSQELWSSHVLKVERRLLDICDRFDAAGIDYRLFKGAALTRAVYRIPEARLYTDIDLLVRGEQLDQAAVILKSDLGGGQVMPELRPGFDREFGKGLTVRCASVQVDLHRTFVLGPIGLLVPVERFFEHSGVVEIGGRQVRTFGRVASFLYSCINAAVGDFPARALSLRDLAETADRYGIVRADIENMAVEWRCLAIVQRAIAESSQRLGLDQSELTEWAAELRPFAADRAFMAIYCTRKRSYTRPLASLAVIGGVRPRLRYLSAIVAPQRSYLAARRWSRLAHLKRAIGQLVRR